MERGRRVTRKQVLTPKLTGRASALGRADAGICGRRDPSGSGGSLGPGKSRPLPSQKTRPGRTRAGGRWGSASQRTPSLGPGRGPPQSPRLNDRNAGPRTPAPGRPLGSLSTWVSVVLQLCRQLEKRPEPAPACPQADKHLLGPGVAPAFSHWAGSLPCSSAKPGRTLPLPASAVSLVTVTVPAQWRRPR